MRRLAGTLLTAALWGCGSTDPDSSPKPTARVTITGDRQTDSIGVEFADSLTITVVDSAGLPGAGRDVFLSSELGGFGRIRFVLTLQGAPNPVGLGTLRTDQTGKIRVAVRAAERSGEALFTAVVPSLAVADTGLYIVLPGAPATIQLSTRDTALQVGRALNISASVADRLGNQRVDPVTFSSPDPGLSVAGDRVTATGIGRFRVAARAGAKSDTIRISVVPPGTLAAGGPDGLYVFETDLTGFRRIAPGPVEFLTWASGGGGVYFSSLTAPGLFLVSLGGAVQPIASQAIGQMYVRTPSVSRNGTSLYFTAASDVFGGYRIWKSALDGSNPTILPGIPENPAGYETPSPNNQTLIYAEMLNSGTLHKYDLVSQQPIPFSVPGHAPRWSPDGQLVAYWLDGVIKVMNPDGSSQRVVDGIGNLDLGPDWSPDSKWLVVSDYGGRITLIELATGVTLPLPHPNIVLRWPSWKP